MKNSRRDSSTRKSRKYHLECSSDSDDKGDKIILLPEQLLSEAKSKISTNSSISSLRKAMKIYDIDEEINYRIFFYLEPLMILFLFYIELLYEQCVFCIYICRTFSWFLACLPLL